MYLDDEAAEVVLQQSQRLVQLLNTPKTWEEGPYGRTLKICDEDSVRDIKRVCQRIVSAAEKREDKGHGKEFASNIQFSRDFVGGHTISTGLRSAAPLSMKSQTEIPDAFNQYWSEGTVMPFSAASKVPNPMFAGLVSKQAVLHYGTDPLLGFHLATAFAQLSTNSPLKPLESADKFKVAAAAKAQFFAWVKAFQALKKCALTLRFVVSDAFSFCHTLQYAAATGKVSANWYRRQWDGRIQTLDEKSYGEGCDGPTTFDMIDTSNLSDHIGLLNMLVSTAGLLNKMPWATLCTEQLLKRNTPEKEALDKLLCGRSSTVSLLLGFIPLQYWTNAKSESHAAEVFLGLMLDSKKPDTQKQLHNRLAWKNDSHMTGYAGGRPKLSIEAKALAIIVFQLYLQMFSSEMLPIGSKNFLATMRDSTYNPYHRGSFVTLLKLVRSRVQTDWSAMMMELMKQIPQDRKLILASNQMQELCVQLHIQGVYTEEWVLDELKPEQGNLLFKGWAAIPPAVAVTVIVPKEAIDRLYKGSKNSKIAAPTLVGSLRAGQTSMNQWHNMFGDAQICFGKIKKTPQGDDENSIDIEQDEKGWLGSSPLIMTFIVPAAALLVDPATQVGVCVQPTGQNSVVYGPILGLSMTVFETKIGDSSHVSVSKFMPGQTAHRVVCGGVQPLNDVLEEVRGDLTTKLAAEVVPSETKITTLTGHVDISSEKGRTLLQSKASIELRQSGPFIIDIVFDKNKLVCPVRFPVPVTKTGSKTRIARTSGYIEIIAPLAEPTKSDSLADFLFPTMLASHGQPVALNMSHLNLDNLPALDLDKAADLRWLTSLTSLQFSAREKMLRDSSDSESGISDDPRVNFKESLFTMFMVASGLQGGRTGMFSITHPENGGIHMLIIVSAIRLDGDAASVVLDAAVIPFTRELIESGQIESFLLLVMTLECCTIRVNDAELLLWKKILPSLAERCRTWSHLPTCEYKKKGAAAPLSVEFGAQTLCSCGNGCLPNDFVAVPEWEVAATKAVRVAISPTYAIPFVEEIVDMSVLAVPNRTLPDVCRCWTCGKQEDEDNGVKLRACSRCTNVRYCSGECQKVDWPTHKAQCKKK